MSCKVTVIIPTYNDWHRLSLCLDALLKQRYPQENFEIIAANNNLADQVPADYKIADNCKIITVAKPGSYAARNAALELAKGEIIAFTDSDCIPDQDWLKNAVDFLEANPTYTRIAGDVKLFYRAKKRNDAELYESLYAFRQDISAQRGLSVTANMITYKKIFDEVGNFNENLFSGGDNEWARRAQAKGYQIAYRPDVLVMHPARHDVKELKKKAIRVGGSMKNKKKWAIKRALKFVWPPITTFFHSPELTFMEKVRVFGLRYQLHLLRTAEELGAAFGKNTQRE